MFFPPTLSPELKSDLLNASVNPQVAIGGNANLDLRKLIRALPLWFQGSLIRDEQHHQSQ
jgi:hypothetical protein